MEHELPPLSKAAQAYLEGAGYLVAYKARSLPMPQLKALNQRSEIVAAEVETKLETSGAARDLNMGYRALRLNGDIDLSYTKFRTQKVCEMARLLGAETVKPTAGRIGNTRRP